MTKHLLRVCVYEGMCENMLAFETDYFLCVFLLHGHGD